MLAEEADLDCKSKRAVIRSDVREAAECHHGGAATVLGCVDPQLNSHLCSQI